MGTTTLIKKHLVRPFLNAGTSENPQWVQIKKAVENTIEMNPTTEDRDYISDEQPTTELTGYKIGTSYGVTTYKGEPDFELFYDLYKNRYTGSDAQKEFLIVYLFDKSEVDGVAHYFAQKWNSTIVVKDFNTVGTVIDVDINANGTPKTGYVTIDASGNVNFTEGDMPVDDGYTLLTSEPADWASAYASYYTRSGSTYIAVAGVSQTQYTVTDEEPADWSTNYTDYYTKSGDVYSPVTGESAPTWEAETYYAQSVVTVAPEWTTDTYYSKDE